MRYFVSLSILVSMVALLFAVPGCQQKPKEEMKPAGVTEPAKEMGKDAMEKGKEAVEAGKEAAGKAVEQGKEAAGKAMEQGKEMMEKPAGEAMEKGKDMMEKVPAQK